MKEQSGVLPEGQQDIVQQFVLFAIQTPLGIVMMKENVLLLAQIGVKIIVLQLAVQLVN